MGFGKIFRPAKEGQICIVTFDVPGEQMNTWTKEATGEFGELLDYLEKEDDLRGVIFISGKPHNFHSGANLKFLEGFRSREEFAASLDVFHRAFVRLEEAKFVSLAAIHGHCLGGGYEFALACTARLVRESKATVIGLPECLLGLFPGGGGTQRLTRLIGYPAVELILSGKTLPAGKAFEMGLVDRVVPEDRDLLQEAKNFLNEIIAGTAVLNRPVHDFSGIDSVVETARQKVLEATRGRELPAPMYALRAIREGVKLPLKEALEVEKRYFVEVVFSKEARGSIHTFFLKTQTDKPLSMLPRGFQPRPVKKAAVLGFGTMGRGIVIEILRHMQIPVVVKDYAAALEPGKAFVRKILEDMASRKKLRAPVDDLMDLITTTSGFGDDFRDVDLVIEAVFEDPEVKDAVYRELCTCVPDDCIVASNTSTIPITRMARSVKNPERFAGAHFFSPVWRMELLEIIRGKKTDPDVIYNLISFAAAIKKRPVVCRDYPGFVVNALLLPYFLKVYELLEQGVPIEKVDAAMVRFGLPVGPVKLSDEVGIDVQYKALLACGIEPPETLKRVIEDGRFGLKKSGKGFFTKDGQVDPEVLPLIAVKGEPKEMPFEEIQMTLFREFVKKGRELLDEGIVDSPKTIDVAMIWGTGFPPDKGGPLKWADLTGLSEELFQKKFYPE